LDFLMLKIKGSNALSSKASPVTIDHPDRSPWGDEALVPKEDPSSGNGRYIDSTPATLLVENLSFSYPDGQMALRDVSLRIGYREKVALVGPNGAGKSTLILHLNGILSGQGQVHVAGLPVTRSNLPTVRAKVGMVFQNPDDQLFSPTVFEDVAFGPLHMGLPEDEVRICVDRALRQVGMSHYAERLSHHLSVGEKKRISIATVLSMEPEILILDEPSAGLDPRARRGLMTLLRDMPLTMLVSTHDMLMVRELFPRMVIMDEGRIVADGPTEWLMNDTQLLEAHGLERP
jgi:cobalt/nickel transport system ATP-binding protein